MKAMNAEQTKAFDLAKVEQWDGRFAVKAEKPTYREIKDEHGRVIDYQDVRIEGYANTFNLDRMDEQTIPGSFAQHLQEYLSNPILLIDHVRETGFAAGSVKTAYEDETGLKITAMLSNAPGERMRDIRFKTVEGILKTLSIGGRFHGKAIGEQVFITKVELREISIVTVPANKESLFEVKEDAATRSAGDYGSEKTDHDDPVGAADEPLYLVDEQGEEYEIVI